MLIKKTFDTENYCPINLDKSAFLTYIKSNSNLKLYHMKIFFTLALTVMALSIANAQTPTTKETAKTVKVADQADMKNEKITPTATPIAIGAPDVSQNFAGTNDLNLLLLRQGIIKA